ncbi:class I adenylate-forming enzyme family protein [Streptomyces umbrinus]|uniref:class I adenylate-forming enzyme family protein n=1 Tax=Streptomyces umbrinus TaxID=67370 RepID=UPI003C3077F8
MPTRESPSGTPTGLGGLLRQAAQKFPASEFVFPAERCTFAEMDRRADAFAAALTAAGVAHGEHVGIWMPPRLDTIAAFFGAFRAGAVAVPVSDRFQPEEVGYAIEHADLTALVISGDQTPFDRVGALRLALPSLADARGPALSLAEAPRLRRLVVVGGDPVQPGFVPAAELGLPPQGTYPEITLPAPAVDHAGERDLAYLMYTSGTSAAPKACMITHAGCLLQADSLAFHRYLLDVDSAFWCPLPLYHTAGLATMTACIASGANFVHAGAFDPGQSLRTMQEEQVTHAIPAFETIWMRVLDHPDFASTDLKRLRVALMTGGEDLLRKLQARLPHVAQITNFGMTESTGHLSMNRIDDPLEVRVTTGGFPLPGMQVRIVDPETQRVLGADQRGEIQFRGASRCLGYYRDPDTTEKTTAPGGWFRSGDLGVMDAEGRLTFRGRLKDMLKVGGENVAALEVESYLVRHPAVSIAAVVGVPDAYYGEVPVAFIELAPAKNATEQDIIEFCLDTIATFKVPRYVRFIDTWPMSGTKIKKFVLREQIMNELTAAGITEAPRIRSTRARQADAQQL